MDWADGNVIAAWPGCSPAAADEPASTGAVAWDVCPVWLRDLRLPVAGIAACWLSCRTRGCRLGAHAASSESFNELFGQVAGVFSNAAVRRHRRAYVLGLLSHTERKNSWSLAEFAGAGAAGCAAGRYIPPRQRPDLGVQQRLVLTVLTRVIYRAMDTGSSGRVRPGRAAPGRRWCSAVPCRGSSRCYGVLLIHGSVSLTTRPRQPEGWPHASPFPGASAAAVPVLDPVRIDAGSWRAGGVRAGCA